MRPMIGGGRGSYPEPGPKVVPQDDPDYADADAYFTTLASLARLLHDPSMKKAFAELEDVREISVGELIAFMQAYNPRFAPATTGRQLEIYRVLVTLLGRVLDDVNGASPAPPPARALADKDGKALQGVAREAFQGMPWPQLEAHDRQP